VAPPWLPEPDPSTLLRYVTAAVIERDRQTPRIASTSDTLESHRQRVAGLKPKWDRPTRLLTVDDQKVPIAQREAPTQFAVLDLLEKAGWPSEGVSVPKGFRGLKDAVDALNKRLVSTRLRILRLDNNNRVGWTLTPL
jgi:hypothetical protein